MTMMTLRPCDITNKQPLMVKFENVVKEFGKVRAVDGLSFTIEEGENTVLLGTSGCGKSTLSALLVSMH